MEDTPSCSRSCSVSSDNGKESKHQKSKGAMAVYDIPSSILEQLKCDLCHEYLSFPPITRYADSGSVCGRCPTLEPEKNIQPLREKNYELLATICTFPCRYKSSGCLETLPLIQVQEHELNCGFKPYFCPVLPLGVCAWQGSIGELHGHFACNHPIMLLENPEFEFDMVNNYNEHYLLPYFDEMFLLRTEFNNSDKLFKSSVHLIGKPNDAVFYEYEIVFKTGNTDKRWTYPKKQVQDDTNLTDRSNESTVDLPTLQTVLEQPTIIICTVEIHKLLTSLDFEESEEDSDQYIELEVQPEASASSIPSPRNKMLDEIECPVCNEYMTSPIFQCVTGHSICENCKRLVKECPTCRGEIANTRNFTLEKIIENIEYNCMHNDEGCKFIGNSCNIRKHDQECKFKPSRCPLHEVVHCDWQGVLKKSFTHAKNAHAEKILNSFVFETTFNQNCSRFEDFMMKYEHGQIFRIRYFYCNETAQVSCTVQCVTPSEGKNFLYEMSVLDCSKSGFELKSKKFCGSFSDAKDDIKHCTLWHLDMVKPLFGPNQILKLKCLITKASRV